MNIQEIYHNLLQAKWEHMPEWTVDAQVDLKAILGGIRATAMLDAPDIYNKFVEAELPAMKPELPLNLLQAKVALCCQYLLSYHLQLFTSQALQVYRADRLGKKCDIAPEDVLSPDLGNGILAFLRCVYQYATASADLIQFEPEAYNALIDLLEAYLDIVQVVAPCAEVRTLRDAVRPFFAQHFQVGDTAFPELEARWTAAASAYAPAYAQRQVKGADHPLTNREFAAYMDEKVIPRARKTARDVAFIKKQNEGDFGEEPKRYQTRLTGVKLKAHRIGEKLISAGFRFSPVSNAIYKHFEHNKGFDYKNARTFRESLVRFYKCEQGITTIRNIKWNATPPINKLLEYIAKIAREK